MKEHYVLECCHMINKSFEFNIAIFTKNSRPLLTFYSIFLIFLINS